MSASDDGELSEPLVSIDQLLEPFHAAEKPAAQFVIGVEAEKFGVLAADARPLPYAGSRGVLEVFARFQQRFGWQPRSEVPHGPTISMLRGAASLTLEPGAQLELSGAPQPDLHGIRAELDQHHEELRSIGAELGVNWLSVGFHPVARADELPWVPKQRYAVMRRYLPTRGARALDMMQRTATVQANFDFESEKDALRKLRLALRVTPIVQAITANAPFLEASVSRRRSERVDTWLHMDPDRSGLIEELWDSPAPGYEQYVRWALKAGMFMFKRGEHIFENAGQPFEEFLKSGYEGQRARKGDWLTHLSSLFPEARLKRTLEVRSADALPAPLLAAVPALFTGLLYDASALARAEALTADLSHADARAAQVDVAVRALAAELGGRPILPLAEQLLDIAAGGLERRGRLDGEGRDERRHIEPLVALVQSGRAPADVLLEGLHEGQSLAPEQWLPRVVL